MKKNLLLSIIVLVGLNACNVTPTQSVSPYIDFIERVLPGRSNEFVLKVAKENNSSLDYFKIYAENEKIVIEANNGTAMGMGVNWYLKEIGFGNISRDGVQLPKQERLPLPVDTLKGNSELKYRYYLNYCTYNYSASFWDWNDWEREIDWMALNGVNMPLAIIGTEAVWQNTLRQFKMTDDEILKFIPGPAYTAWWLMGNLEGWGGPVSQQWIDSRVELQQKIVKRMRELDMEPVFQGFYGMVPNALIEKFPENKIIKGGWWPENDTSEFMRPAFINPEDSLFSRMAKVYYDEQDKLYGKTSYYGGDPFHEGGSTEGIDISKGASQIQKCMQQSHPESKWVLQGWWDNPTDELLAGIDKQHTIVLDLFAEGNPQWERRNAYNGVPWIWSILQNFGGNVGMFGSLHKIASEPIRAKSLYPSNFQGIGAMMEDNMSNPVVYDLLFEMAWRKDSVDLNQWSPRYATYRYGAHNEKAARAWQILAKTVYKAPPKQEGTSESILCARPNLEVKSAFKYGTSKIYYNNDSLELALKLLLEAAPQFADAETYRYDLVDLSRQCLANYSQKIYQQWVFAYNSGNINDFKKYSNLFVEIIEDQDSLLATRSEFLLGKWISDARKMGFTPVEKDLFEQNARTLITVWGNYGVSTVLHEYSHREWSGMLKYFYLPRWKMYFDYLEKNLNGESPKIIDFYSWESTWTKSHENYANAPQGDAVEMSKYIYDKWIKR